MRRGRGGVLGSVVVGMWGAAVILHILLIVRPPHLVYVRSTQNYSKYLLLSMTIFMIYHKIRMIPIGSLIVMIGTPIYIPLWRFLVWGR